MNNNIAKQVILQAALNTIAEKSSTGASTLAIAKKAGKYHGRKPVKIREPEFKAQYDRYMRRELNKGQMAETLGVSRPTLDKLLREHAKNAPGS